MNRAFDKACAGDALAARRLASTRWIHRKLRALWSSWASQRLALREIPRL